MTNIHPDPEMARLWRLRFRAQDLQRSAARLAEDLRDEAEGLSNALNAATGLAAVEDKLVKRLAERDA